MGDEFALEIFELKSIIPITVLSKITLTFETYEHQILEQDLFRTFRYPIVAFFISEQEDIVFPS